MSLLSSVELQYMGLLDVCQYQGVIYIHSLPPDPWYSVVHESAGMHGRYLSSYSPPFTFGMNFSSGLWFVYVVLITLSLVPKFIPRLAHSYRTIRLVSSVILLESIDGET